MDSHEQLHRTLRAAAQLLDSAASQIRDLPLHPTRENIRLVAEALAITFQVRRNVEVELPALAKQHPEPIEEDSAANKRLGDALVAADDGLADIRRICAKAPAHLQPGGWLWLEHGHQQHDAVQQILTEAGFIAVQSRRDYGGNWRISGGYRPD